MKCLQKCLDKNESMKKDFKWILRGHFAKKKREGNTGGIHGEISEGSSRKYLWRIFLRHTWRNFLINNQTLLHIFLSSPKGKFRRSSWGSVQQNSSVNSIETSLVEFPGEIFKSFHKEFFLTNFWWFLKVFVTKNQMVFWKSF